MTANPIKTLGAKRKSWSLSVVQGTKRGRAWWITWKRMQAGRNFSFLLSEFQLFS